MSAVEELPPFRYRQPRMEYVEDVEKYVPGGYHPVDIGDVIGTGTQQYEVIHKLGHGGFSTVWLVQLRSDIDRPSYFALKILYAEVSDSDDDELRALQHLREVSGPLGHPNVLTLYHSFKISGPNGEHLCLVFPVLGPSLKAYKILEALSGLARHQLCCQVASGMAFLHEHGVCHGDFTPTNVAFELPNIHSMSRTQLYQLLGDPESEPLKLGNGSYSEHAPKRVIQTPNFPSLDYSSLSRVVIVDFGNAFFADSPPQSSGSPIDFFPPEICFGYSPSTKSDVWQLACVLYTIHAREPLFPTFFRIFEILVGTIVGFQGSITPGMEGPVQVR